MPPLSPILLLRFSSPGSQAKRGQPPPEAVVARLLRHDISFHFFKDYCIELQLLQPIYRSHLLEVPRSHASFQLLPRLPTQRGDYDDTITPPPTLAAAAGQIFSLATAADYCRRDFCRQATGKSSRLY